MASASSETGRRKGLGPNQASPRALARVVAIPIDAVADAAIAARAVESPNPRCGVCDVQVSGEAGRGLLVWSRGDEVRYEEPFLCEPCANVLGMTALAQWEREEEDDE